MAAFIRLEDGRAVAGSSVWIDALLTAVADAVPDDQAEFKVWLADIARRPAPFQDIDLSALDDSFRELFYSAVARALAEKLSNDPQNPLIDLLDRLIKMRESMARGEPPLAMSDCDFVLKPHPIPHDLKEIWG